MSMLMISRGENKKKGGGGCCIFGGEMQNKVSVWFVDPVWEMWVLMNYTSIDLSGIGVI